ncbi:processed acidic surface protein [Oceanobacillus iheyensis]|uniref:processed acidic surface protein n=1 Tax=Oceanobacillus iheyensis TaxID=182710 RepID=UPI00363CC11C
MRHKLLTALFIMILGFTIIPTIAFAIEADDPEVEAFIEEIGWDKEEYVDYLESKYFSLIDFPSIEYLGIPVTEKTLEEIYNTYDITHEELNEKLRETGQLLEDEDVVDSTWFLFIEDVAFALEQDMDNTGELTDWEEEITEENIQALLDFYEFKSSEELEQYLNSMNDSIDNYETIWELDLAVDSYIGGQDITSDLTDDLSGDFGSGMDMGIWNAESIFPTDPYLNVFIGLTPIALQAIFF